MVKAESKPVSEEELEKESNIEQVVEKDGLNSVNVTPDDTNYDSETYVGLPAEEDEEKTGDEPKKGKDGKSYIEQRKSYNMSNVDKNKLMNTHIGDHINYFDNGRQDNGVVAKMDSSFITILKEDGQVHKVHINDTFFVSDILVNKTWNDMDMEERTVQLQKVHAYSPRYLSKTWEQLPVELRDTLKFNRKEFFENSTGDRDATQGVKVGGKTVNPTNTRTFGHGSKINHYDPNARRPAHMRTSNLKDILAEAQTSASMSDQGKGISFKKQSMGRLLDDDGHVIKVSRSNGAYKKNQALGQSIQGNVEKEGDAGTVTTSTEGTNNPIFNKKDEIIKGVPEQIKPSWGIKYINKDEEEE